MAPQGDGHALRTHLEAAERQSGVRPPELDGPDCPWQVAYLWGWFTELDFARGSNGFGFNPLSWAEIAAWAGLHRITPTRFEIESLSWLDRLRLEAAASKQESK